ncbi:transcriptional regulator [Pseudonocardia saturnea]|nr:transcriptional regulator [Pseudonocardia autotrophica]GEC23549.1 transcriptional regulator [Pseudonocardia saturnea]
MTLVHQLRAVTVELDLLGAEFARKHRLHPTDLRALIHLLDAERAGISATPTWLTEQMALDASSVTALIGRLVKAGHVRRYRDPSDGRRVLLEVDEQAVALGWSFFGPLIKDLVGTLRSFEPADLDAVTRFLAAAVAAIERQRSQRDDRTGEAPRRG